jgi:acetylornithine deacetylase
MRAVGAHKGYRVFRTTITGMPTHASSPASGVSAIRLAGAFLSALEALSRELATQEHIDGGVDPPFTTVNIGRIAGGTAVNIVASDCVIEWELRPVPGTDPDAVLQRLDGLVEAALPSDLAERGGIGRIATTLLASEPVFASPPDGLAGRLIGCLTGRSDLGAVAYGTEAGFFQQAGVSTILLGPGNIDRAHRPDEFIEVGELDAQLDFLIALERQLCTHGLNDL